MNGEYLGCMAKGCAIEPPVGVHHQGPCSCLAGMDPDRRANLLEAIGRTRAKVEQLKPPGTEAIGRYLLDDVGVVLRGPEGNRKWALALACLAFRAGWRRAQQAMESAP